MLRCTTGGSSWRPFGPQLSRKDVRRAMPPVWKIPFIVVGVPVATWLGIGTYWAELRSSGEAPAYYVGSMVGLRGFLVMPVQLLAMSLLALVARKILVASSWTVLVIACAIAGAFAYVGDATGMHYFRSGEPDMAHTAWDTLPHFVGPAVIILVTLASPWAPNKSMQTDDASRHS